MTQNELYELVADFGEVCGTALRRDSSLARGIDWPENWLEVADAIGEARAETLSEGRDAPTATELRHLIRWQVGRALLEENSEVTPTIWFCQPDAESDVLVVEAWGVFMRTKLTFRLIGRYPTQIDAAHELKKDYLFDVDDL